jgi:predicted nucleotidyltransferase
LRESSLRHEHPRPGPGDGRSLVAYDCEDVQLDRRAVQRSGRDVVEAVRDPTIVVAGRRMMAGMVAEERNMGTHAELDAKLQQIVDRIVSGFSPLRIILFGSRARGTASADSDVDLLVVTDRPGSKRQQAVAIDLAVADIRVAKDIVVVGAEELERERDVVGTIAYPACREGVVLYDRAA